MKWDYGDEWKTKNRWMLRKSVDAGYKRQKTWQDLVADTCCGEGGGEVEEGDG